MSCPVRFTDFSQTLYIVADDRCDHRTDILQFVTQDTDETINTFIQRFRIIVISKDRHAVGIIEVNHQHPGLIQHFHYSVFQKLMIGAG